MRQRISASRRHARHGGATGDRLQWGPWGRLDRFRNCGVVTDDGPLAGGRNRT